MKHTLFTTVSSLLLALSASPCHSQSVNRFTTTEAGIWQESRLKMSAKPSHDVVLTVDATSKGTPFQAWGTTFNELDWDAFNLLTRSEQDEVMNNIFGKNGDLRFTHGRVSMNANDYSRDWYSCDDISGDFDLKYFNIDHDRQNIIPFARAAQKYCPELQLFMSPWSPPAWMKINHDYPVLSSKYNTMDPRKDYLLYRESATVDADEMKLTGDRSGVFPRRLATQDYFIQDDRYLRTYAEMFCRFIDLYSEEGLKITKVMYQNEAYSYTPYPGCAWTAEGSLRFNNDYLAPALRQRHPDVELWFGTINTNRLDYIQKILDDKTLLNNIKGIGTQWECRNNLPEMRRRYPDHRFMMSESECGNGKMDWKAGEHTFFLISDNLGNGCDEYYNWNFILTDNGLSRWGWSQNALIQVDSKTRRFRYTPEYYAYKHFSHFVSSGWQTVAYNGREHATHPVVVFRNGTSYVVTAGNFGDAEHSASIQIAGRYLNFTTLPHSFNTFTVNIK